MLSTCRGNDFIDIWSPKWELYTKEAIPIRGDCEKDLKKYNGNEMSRISTKFQLCYNLYAFGHPLI